GGVIRGRRWISSPCLSKGRQGAARTRHNREASATRRRHHGLRQRRRRLSASRLNGDGGRGAIVLFVGRLVTGVDRGGIDQRAAGRPEYLGAGSNVDVSQAAKDSPFTVTALTVTSP